MRANGVQTLAAWCLGRGCNHHRVFDASSYRDGGVVGFHSRVSFCASAICAGVIHSSEMMSRLIAASCTPRAADKLSHMYARIKSFGTPWPLMYALPRLAWARASTAQAGRVTFAW